MNIYSSRIIKKRVSIYVFIAGVFLGTRGNAQQFFSYTQYMNNLTPLNNAYSVLDKNNSLSSLYRKQWAGIDGSPQTFMISGVFPIESHAAAAGFTIVDDKFAVEQQTEINSYFAKSIQLAENNYLAVSLNAGIRKYVANYSVLASNDPNFYTYINQTQPNIGFGALYYTDRFYVGVSVPDVNIHLLGNASVDNGIYFRNHYYFSGAFLVGNTNDDMVIKPAILLSYTKGIPFIADISTTLYLKNTFGIGLNFRTNKEIAGIMTYNLEMFKIGYSYQVGTAANNLGGLNFPTHEIIITYRFGKHLDENGLL